MTGRRPCLNQDCPAHYRICVQGEFDPRWLDWLSGEWTLMATAPAEPAAIVLVGRTVDQAALMGVLNGLYGFGLYLLLVECLVEGQSMARPA